MDFDNVHVDIFVESNLLARNYITYVNYAIIVVVGVIVEENVLGKVVSLVD